MNQVFIANYFVGNIGNVFRVFAACPVVGGVSYRIMPNEFHTIEDAHLYLIDLAKMQSDESCLVRCVEVVKEYVFIGDPIQVTQNDEIPQ